MAKTLKQKAASGMVWTALQKYSQMGIQFISGIILARLLTPYDYGCIGMLSIFMVLAEAFIDGGFGSALIQKKNPTQTDYSTVFYFNIGMSLVLYLALFFSAPAIARFYRMPILCDVLRVQGLILFIYSFNIIQQNIIRKNLRFKKLSKVTIVTSIISLIITVVMAYMGFGEYHAGDWCQFCRASGICKAQAEQQTSAFEDFSEIVDKSPALLTPEEMGKYLQKGKNLVIWYDALKQKALDKLLSGCPIPGYKAVEGRSTRTWKDQDKALEILEAGGIEHAMIYDSVPKSLAQLEKVVGAAKFKELVGDLIIKPQGKPTLATADDSRKEFNSAVADFAAVANG